MIGIPANSKINPEKVWEDNFKLIRNSMNEEYGKKLLNDIFEYYNEEVSLDKIVDFLLIQDKIRDMEDFSAISYGNVFFEQNQLTYYKHTEQTDEDDEENDSFLKKEKKPEYDILLIKTRLFQYFIEELVEDIPENAILRNEQDVVEFIKMYEVKFLYECLIPISELKDTKKRKRLN